MRNGVIKSAALLCALDLLRVPRRVGMMRSRPLPDGVHELLAILAGDAETIASASRRFGYSPARLREASDFFVSQVMFTSDADAYRVLGCDARADKERLRAHAGLLLRWLHPDTASDQRSARAVTRVTAAWNDLKTDERRAAYDAARSLRARAIVQGKFVDAGLGSGPVRLAQPGVRVPKSRRRGLPKFLGRLFSRSPLIR